MNLTALYALVLILVALFSVCSFIIGRAAGYREGYREARTLPIGRIRSSTTYPDGLTVVADLDPDVKVTP